LRLQGTPRGWQFRGNIRLAPDAAAEHNVEITNAMLAKLYLVGKRFGIVNVIGPGPIRIEKTTSTCLCDCGRIFTAYNSNLKSGKTKSCGCVRKEITRIRSTKHGHSPRHYPSKTYAVWNTIIQRCANPNKKDFQYYGGRGIFVCERWRFSFPNFLQDMGEAPPGLTIDRINNDHGYAPGNCRWATRNEQAKNKRARRWRKRPQ